MGGAEEGVDRRGSHCPCSMAANVELGRERESDKNPPCAPENIIPRPIRRERVGENRGGYDCEFVERPTDPLQGGECPLCLLVLKEPCLISCCGHKYCRACIELVKRDSKPCPLCNAKDFSFLQERGLERFLKDLDVWCTYRGDGCDWKGKLGSLELHLNINPSSESQLTGCQFVGVKCMYECGDWFERRHISIHQTEQCTERPYSCQYCKDYDSTFVEVTEVHYTDCGDYPVNCPNNCQEQPLKRQKLESHLENGCPLKTIDCPFSHAGCAAQFPRKDMPEHMKDTATHLTLIASVTHSLVKENKQLREEMDKLKVDLHLGFPKVYNVKKTDEEVYLPKFYTHHNGYKMCLCVDPNGDGDGEGTHVSIFTYLMEGSYDFNLKWPFRGQVTIQIVNQAGDHDHIEKIITYNDQTPDDTAARVTSGERSAGWGVQFLAHSDLEYNAAKKTQYLKDNQLIIHVVKVELM